MARIGQPSSLLPSVTVPKDDFGLATTRHQVGKRRECHRSRFVRELRDYGPTRYGAHGDLAAGVRQQSAIWGERESCSVPVIEGRDFVGLAKAPKVAPFEPA